MSIFDGLRNNSKNERLNDSRNWQSNDLNGINKINKL